MRFSLCSCGKVTPLQTCTSSDRSIYVYICVTFPKGGQTVVVHYEGRLQDGSMFDSSKSRNVPFRFVLGDKQVIRGLEENIKKMSVGQIIKLTCPPEFAYGKLGFPGVIPSNATLYFTIELLAIE